MWQPPHVCLCGGAELPGVEAWLQGDDCYSTGVGFKNAFLMGTHFTGKSTEIWEANITATGGQKFSVRLCLVHGLSVETACHLLLSTGMADRLLGIYPDFALETKSLRTDMNNLCIYIYIKKK